MDDLLPDIYDFNGGKRERRAPTQPAAGISALNPALLCCFSNLSLFFSAMNGTKPRPIAAAQAASPRRRQPLMGGKVPPRQEQSDDTCSVM